MKIYYYIILYYIEYRVTSLVNITLNKVRELNDSKIRIILKIKLSHN